MPSSMGEISAMANGTATAGPGSGFVAHHKAQQHQQGLPYPPLMDRCAGCGRTDHSLLACDDLDGAASNSKDGLPAIGDPSQRQRSVYYTRTSGYYSCSAIGGILIKAKTQCILLCFSLSYYFPADIKHLLSF